MPQNIYTHGKTGIIRVSELSKEDVELVIWRTGIHKKIFITICLHYHYQYLENVTLLNPFFCDPFRHHGDKKSKGNKN